MREISFNPEGKTIAGRFISPRVVRRAVVGAATIALLVPASALARPSSRAAKTAIFHADTHARQLAEVRGCVPRSRSVESCRGSEVRLVCAPNCIVEITPIIWHVRTLDGRLVARAVWAGSTRTGSLRPS